MQLAAGHSWRPDTGLGRWGGALATILVLHAGAALGSMIVWEATDPPTPPPAAIMLELAPLPAAPPAPKTAAPPEPKPAPEPEPVNRSQLLPIPELPLTPPDIPKPEVELPKPEPEKRKTEKPKQEKKKEKPKKEKPKEQPKKPKPDPEPVLTQQPAQPAQEQAAAAAPAPPAPTPAAPSAAELARRAAAEANWQGILQAHLQKHQKYPRSALRRHVEGSAFIRFRMDRSGKLLSSSLVRTSGHEVLDEESLAMLERAQPLPPLPAEVAGESIQIDIPVVFNLKDAR